MNTATEKMYKEMKTYLEAVKGEWEEKAKNLIKELDNILQIYGEGEFMHNWYQIIFCPFKKQVDKNDLPIYTMIYSDNEWYRQNNIGKEFIVKFDYNKHQYYFTSIKLPNERIWCSKIEKTSHCLEIELHSGHKFVFIKK